MISSRDILKRTGLKSSKTLTRWYKAGIIPEPSIGTHPSGRGKMAYWPDFVLDRCLRITELRKKGYSLGAAVVEIDRRNIEVNLKHTKEIPSLSDILAGKKVLLKGGGESSLLDIFLYFILLEIEKLECDKNTIRQIVSKVKETKALDKAFVYLERGYNPILLYSPDTLLIMPDFMVSHYLSLDLTNQRCLLTIPLIPGLKKAYSVIGKELQFEQSKRPVSKILVTYGDTLVERDVFLVGIDRFELMEEFPGKTVGKIEKQIKTRKGTNKNVMTTVI